MIGITPIILTSSAESVRESIENAIRTWHQNQKLLSSNAMMQTLIQSSSNRHLILDLDGNCLYSTLDGEKEDGHETVEVENLHHAIRLMQKKDEDA